MPKKKQNKQVKNLKPVVHIFCEGKTEEMYIDKYKTIFCHSNKRIKIQQTRYNTPKALVDVAIRQKEIDNLPNDQYWVVYDRESAVKYTEALHSQAYQKANQYRIGCVISNVCFEVWILLHFQNTCASYGSFDELWRRSDLKKHIPDYEKGTNSVWNCFRDGDVERAMLWAERMNSQTLSGAPAGMNLPYQLNPYTNMHELLNNIKLWETR